MITCRTARAGNWPCFASACAGLLAALALALPGAAAHAASTKDSALSKEDKACLECHAKPDQFKTLANGEPLSLVISSKRFAESLHASSGCEACHSDIDAASHAKEPKKIATRRALAAEMMETCRDCHKKAVTQYQDSVHSALVRIGSDKAPLCSDCHNPHATRSLKDASADEPVVCAKCHEPISKAFTQSVHGSSGDEALTCKDCHHTHNVKAAAFADNMRQECLSCHKDAVASHAQWLPNTERHLEAISCPACHSPGATRRVNLRLYEGAAPQQSTEKVGVPKFVKLANWADATGTGLDARALWSLLQEFNQNGSAMTTTMLRGRLEVQTGEQAHQLARKAQAVKDCDTCHREGAMPFQTVSVSMAGPDGRPIRHQARDGVLTSVESIGSIGGFYAIGGTRIKLLDLLLVLVLAGGILVPSAHLTMKLLVKRQRAHASAAPDGQPPVAQASEKRK